MAGAVETGQLDTRQKRSQDLRWRGEEIGKMTWGGQREREAPGCPCYDSAFGKSAHPDSPAGVACFRLTLSAESPVQPSARDEGSPNERVRPERRSRAARRGARADRKRGWRRQRRWRFSRSAGPRLKDSARGATRSSCICGRGGVRNARAHRVDRGDFAEGAAGLPDVARAVVNVTATDEAVLDVVDARGVAASGVPLVS